MSEECVTTTPEPFVPADVAAHHVGVKRRFLLELARNGIAGAYSLGTGKIRTTWVFQLSELSSAIKERRTRTMPMPDASKRGTIRSGWPSLKG
jgi:hypothetical protein